MSTFDRWWLAVSFVVIAGIVFFAWREHHIEEGQAKTCSAFGGIPVRGHLAAVVCLDPKAQK